MTDFEDRLLHDGVKGMKWGVVRWRKTKAVSPKANTEGGRIKQEWNSLKRERQWKSTIQNIDKMTTKEITSVGRRVSLENELKKLSKSGMKKDKQDYRLRGKMSDQELNRKVMRLRAKSALKSQVNLASKEQKAIGERIASSGGSIALKYALNRKVSIGDIYEAIAKPEAAKQQSIKTVLDFTAKQAQKKFNINIKR